MFDKLKKYFVSKDVEQQYRDYVAHFRDSCIPKKYNQIELMDELLNPDLDHYISISNRSDGKSFNYIHFLIDFAIEYDVGFILLARHFTVRHAYQKMIERIATSDVFRHNARGIQFVRGDFYITVIYEDKNIGVITDLNQATDLKYFSNFLQDFPIITYDEFLALESDYIPDEWERLKTIYASVNRENGVPFINNPKIIYLGNAVNFSSPILANLDIFNQLENHPMNTKQIYDNVIMELRKNDNANEERNLRAFDETKDPLHEAQFHVNHHQLATEKMRQHILQNPYIFHVKLDGRNYLRVTYNPNIQKPLLSIVAYAQDYDFHTNLADNKPTSKFLNDFYFDENHYKKHDKGLFLYDNNFSKEQILDRLGGIVHLKIFKMIGEYVSKVNQTPENMNGQKEKMVKENIREKDVYIERTKKALARKFGV